mmetsp:Transcript_16911/g.42457  ORF Transcript_16911/g.42457 Transcript_16911/m.42457 type:complete len:135 (+) Transcript_16911:808-1212(+)
MCKTSTTRLLCLEQTRYLSTTVGNLSTQPKIRGKKQDGAACHSNDGERDAGRSHPTSLFVNLIVVRLSGYAYISFCSCKLFCVLYFMLGCSGFIVTVLFAELLASLLQYCVVHVGCICSDDLALLSLSSLERNR